MSHITIDLGGPMTGDQVTLSLRWIDDNNNSYTEDIIIENDDCELLITHDDQVLLRAIGADENKEK